MTWTLYISDQASCEIDEIWEYGFGKSGQQVADDYKELIQQVLSDIKHNPCRQAVREMSGFSEPVYS